MWHLISLLNNLIFFAHWLHFDMFCGAILRALLNEIKLNWKFTISQQYTALLYSSCILELQLNADIGWYISMNNCMCINGHQNETVKDSLHSWWLIFERNCFKRGRCGYLKCLWILSSLRHSYVIFSGASIMDMWWRIKKVLDFEGISYGYSHTIHCSSFR